MVPQSFEEWLNCIVNQCGIKLTKAFAEQRLAVYQNKEDPETKRFVTLYGTQHLNNVINWYSIYA